MATSLEPAGNGRDYCIEERVKEEGEEGNVTEGEGQSGGHPCLCGLA